MAGHFGDRRIAATWITAINHPHLGWCERNGMMIDMFMTLIHISSHQSLKCLTSSLKCLWHWLQLDIALMGWFFWTHDQNDSHVVLGWGCTGMVDIGELLKIFGKHGYKVSTKLRYVAYKVVRLYIFYVEIWLFSILNSYTECICIHTNNTHIYIYSAYVCIYIYTHVTDHLDSWLPRVFLCPRNEPKMTLLVPSELKIFDTVAASVSLSDFISDFRGEKTLKNPQLQLFFLSFLGGKGCSWPKSLHVDFLQLYIHIQACCIYYVYSTFFNITLWYISGWWFGTFFIFPYILGIIIPTDRYFSEGRYTNQISTLHILLYML